MTREPSDLSTDDFNSTTAAAHPEEMKGTVEFKLGNLVTATATGRTTPAGLACAALLVAAVLFLLAMMVRRRAVREIQIHLRKHGSPCNEIYEGFILAINHVMVWVGSRR